LFESDPHPDVNLTWLVKCSEILWTNHKLNNSMLSKLETKHQIDAEIRVKITALIVR